MGDGKEKMAWEIASATSRTRVDMIINIMYPSLRWGVCVSGYQVRRLMSVFDVSRPKTP